MSNISHPLPPRFLLLLALLGERWESLHVAVLDGVLDDASDPGLIILGEAHQPQRDKVHVSLVCDVQPQQVLPLLVRALVLLLKGQDVLHSNLSTDTHRERNGQVKENSIFHPDAFTTSFRPVILYNIPSITLTDQGVSVPQGTAVSSSQPSSGPGPGRRPLRQRLPARHKPLSAPYRSARRKVSPKPTEEKDFILLTSTITMTINLINEMICLVKIYFRK